VIHLEEEERRLQEFERSRRAAEDRRASALEIVDHALTSGDVRDVAALLLDPDPDVRLLGVRGIGEAADAARWDALVPVLEDPVDEVRAAAATVLARDRAFLSDVVRFVCPPRWPRTGRAVLEALPDLIRRTGLRDEELTRLLFAVAEPAVPPSGPDADRLGDLADAIGIAPIVAALSAADPRRLGAVRLLAAEGSDEALAALAGLADDPDEEIRVAAASAARFLGEAVGDEREREPDGGEGGAGLAATEDELIESLARSLVSPDRATRDRVLGDLGQLSWDRVLAWVRSSLQGADVETASHAARVAERLMLSSVAPGLLQRAASLPEEDRAPFLGALHSFELDLDDLAVALDEVAARQRPEAVRLVWRIVGRPILPHLRARLDDASGQVRRAVLEVFAEADGPRAFEAAMLALEGDPSAAVRRQAIGALVYAEHETRRAALERAMGDSQPDVRLAAIRALAPGLGSEGGPILLLALDDRDEDVRREAARRLAGFVHEEPGIVWQALRASRRRERKVLLESLEPEGIAPLSRLVLSHAGLPDPEDRALAMRIARRAVTPGTAQALVRGLQDPAPQVRLAAARSLSTAADPAAIPALAQSLRDPDAEVRAAVVEALAEVDDEAVLEHLVTALEDPEPRVRETVARALSSHGSQQLARRLGSALSRPAVRQAAAELLAGMGPVAVDLLVDALMDREDDDPDLPRTVGRALRKVVDPVELARWLDSIDVARRHRGVEAVAAIGGPEAVETLERALSDPDVGIRLRTLHRLAELADPRAAVAVRRAVTSDPVAEVADAANAVLRRLAPDDERSTRDDPTDAGPA
jgi:HEAT repeat protein